MIFTGEVTLKKDMENNSHIKVIADTAWVCDMLKVGTIET